jgi:hypothetical protein
MADVASTPGGVSRLNHELRQAIYYSALCYTNPTPPAGEVKISVPSGSCFSPHPQKV